MFIIKIIIILNIFFKQKNLNIAQSKKHKEEGYVFPSIFFLSFKLTIKGGWGSENGEERN